MYIYGMYIKTAHKSAATRPHPSPSPSSAHDDGGEEIARWAAVVVLINDCEDEDLLDEASATKLITLVRKHDRTLLELWVAAAAPAVTIGNETEVQKLKRLKRFARNAKRLL